MPIYPMYQSGGGKKAFAADENIAKQLLAHVNLVLAYKRASFKFSAWRLAHAAYLYPLVKICK